jgi:hypothetical protein
LKLSFVEEMIWPATEGFHLDLDIRGAPDLFQYQLLDVATQRSVERQNESAHRLSRSPIAFFGSRNYPANPANAESQWSSCRCLWLPG